MVTGSFPHCLLFGPAFCVCDGARYPTDGGNWQGENGVQLRVGSG